MNSLSDCEGSPSQGIEGTHRSRESENVCEFVDLLNHDDYEILNEYPYTIRKKSNHYVLKEWDNGNGYIRVKLNGRNYLKHRLVAEQFLPNNDSEHKTQVDHINHDESDYHLSNLRWVSPSTNQKNKSSNNGVKYTYVDYISDKAIVVTDYEKHEFEEYYYDETVDKFYYFNGIQYRELHINEHKNGSKYFNMKSTENKKINIYYSKFKKLYGLI